ncbi:MAG: energy-coupling factor transporter ATPase [Clostridia bacterium]|nr:energy-coupling factor transporter ATPase [Clostridia bacterium]
MPIVIEQLNYSYMAGTVMATPALKDISLTIEEGSFFAIIGHTGSGKSTFMQQLNGLLLPTSGKVLVDGFDTSDKQQIKSARARVGMVFQYPEYQLFEDTVLKDVAFGPKNLGMSEVEAEAAAREAMTMVGLDPERFAEKSPFELSGGEKRRAALAGIIAMKPKYLALDEPMAGLDPRGRRTTLDLLEKLRKDTGCAIIMVSHSMDDVARCAETVAVLDGGALVMTGTPGEVFSHGPELRAMGLSLPQSAQMAEELRARGIALPEGIVTPEALAAALKEVRVHG